MRMNKIKKRKFIMTLIALFALGVLFFSFGFKECKDIRYIYTENNSIDYKVYLKENKFFESKYLEKNKTYITSLIDYIDTDFTYNVNFNEAVSGELTYKLVAEIKADKSNNDVGTYWNKEYDLIDEKTDTIKNEKSHEIKLSKKIDYNKYNDLLNSFIKEYSLQAESTLRVYLDVKGNAKVDNTNENMDIDSEVSLTVPLSKLAIEGKIETDNNNKQKEIIKKEKEVEPFKNLLKVLFVITVIMFIYYFFQYVRFLMSRNDHLNYRDRIKKLTSDYEEIITKVKSINVNDFAIIDVESFDDILNVYNSVREPINFLFGEEESRFFIIKGNSCYMYTLIKREINNYDKKKK